MDVLLKQHDRWSCQFEVKLAINGKAICGKRRRHFDFKLFYVTDLIERQEAQMNTVQPTIW